MTQNEFDRILMDDAGSLPPQDFIVAAANPWCSAMEKIMWGMALNVFKLEFFYLQYILPLLGSVLLYLGFRSLRKCSGFFAACWVLSIFGVALILLFNCENRRVSSDRCHRISALYFPPIRSSVVSTGQLSGISTHSFLQYPKG